MKRLLYILMVLMLLISCEEIYHPDLDNVDDLLVVEAAIVANNPVNNIFLYYTKGFNETDESYPSVGGATVYLLDDENNRIDCEEYNEGTYELRETLDQERSYQLYIELNGELYVSEVQSVPDTPHIDTVYGEYINEVSIDGTASSTESINKEYGIKLYADIAKTGKTNHYRFYARKVVQYIDYFDTVIGMMPTVGRIYIWRSVYPTGIFNIAGPAEYSTSEDIKKHPLEFFPRNYNKYFPDTMTFDGWVYIIHQYGLNDDTYEYYDQLNTQLGTEGKIFDPIYTQVEGNITCSSDPSKTVLGNFEVCSYAESRYYLIYDKRQDPFKVKKIPYFYEIPLSGYIKMDQPEFWESIYKTYPDD